MSYIHDEWFLIQWYDGVRAVIAFNDLKCLSKRDARVGKNIAAYRDGNIQTGKIIASADERAKVVQLQIEFTNRSKLNVENPGDNTSSGSSWTASDKGVTSSDPDNEPTKNKEENKNNINEERVAKPPSKLNKIISNLLENVDNDKINGNNDNGSENRKRAEATKQNINDQSSHADEDDPKINISPNKLLNVRTYCYHIMRIMIGLKQSSESENHIEKPVRIEEAIKIVQILLDLHRNDLANTKVDTKVTENDKIFRFILMINKLLSSLR